MAKTENTIRNEINDLPETSEPKRKKRKTKSPPFSFGLSPRVVKISGLLLISASLFLTLSMVSFLFSWQTDQSMVNGLDCNTFVGAKPEMTKNWMGLVGAWASYLLVFRWFGIASFIFVPVIFLTGFRWLFEVQSIPLAKIYSLAAISILFFSVFFGFICQFLGSSLGILGGAFGFETNY